MEAKLNAIGLVVADIAASIAFYSRLGLSFERFGDEHAEATTPGGMRIMLDTKSMAKSIAPDWARSGGSHVFSLAFEMPSVEAVDALFGELASAGHRVLREPWDAEWGQRYAVLLDPDGNGVDLYCSIKG